MDITSAGTTSGDPLLHTLSKLSFPENTPRPGFLLPAQVAPLQWVFRDPDHVLGLEMVTYSIHHSSELFHLHSVSGKTSLDLEFFCIEDPRLLVHRIIQVCRVYPTGVQVKLRGILV